MHEAIGAAAEGLCLRSDLRGRIRAKHLCAASGESCVRSLAARQAEARMRSASTCIASASVQYVERVSSAPNTSKTLGRTTKAPASSASNEVRVLPMRDTQPSTPFNTLTSEWQWPAPGLSEREGEGCVG